MNGQPKTGDRLLELIKNDMETMENQYSVQVVGWCTDDGPDGNGPDACSGRLCSGLLSSFAGRTRYSLSSGTSSSSQTSRHLLATPMSSSNGSQTMVSLLTFSMQNNGLVTLVALSTLLSSLLQPGGHHTSMHFHDFSPYNRQ